MNTKSRVSLKMVLTFVGRFIEGVLVAAGVFTIYDLAAKKWPDQIGVALVISFAVFAVGFIWVTCVAPFLDGYREGKPRK